MVRRSGWQDDTSCRVGVHFVPFQGLVDIAKPEP
jgi:hypothetical protein